jgi:hypothetical protein
VGTWLKEKKVPPRNVMGISIRLPKVAMSSCDLASNAAKTPRKAKVRQVRSKPSRNGKLMWIWGAINRATTRKATELMMPLTTPIRAFPMSSDVRLMGAMRHSSKLL